MGAVVGRALGLGVAAPGPTALNWDTRCPGSWAAGVAAFPAVSCPPSP